MRPRSLLVPFVPVLLLAVPREVIWAISAACCSEAAQMRVPTIGNDKETAMSKKPCRGIRNTEQIINRR